MLVVKWFYYLKCSLALMLALKCSNDQLLWYEFRLAREAGLEYVEIQNLTEFYDDNRFADLSFLIEFLENLWKELKSEWYLHFKFTLCYVFCHCCWNLIIHSPYLVLPKRAQFAGMLMNSGPNLVDPRGRLLPRSYDVLGDAFTLHHLLRNLPLYLLLPCSAVY
jgi:hypothetical protein